MAASLTLWGSILPGAVRRTDTGQLLMLGFRRAPRNERHDKLVLAFLDIVRKECKLIANHEVMLRPEISSDQRRMDVVVDSFPVFGQGQTAPDLVRSGSYFILPGTVRRTGTGRLFDAGLSTRAPQKERHFKLVLSFLDIVRKECKLIANHEVMLRPEISSDQRRMDVVVGSFPVFGQSYFYGYVHVLSYVYP